MVNNANKLPIYEIKSMLRNEQEARRRYFSILKDAGSTAALNLLNQRLNLLEEKDKKDSTLSVTRYFFEIILTVTFNQVVGFVLQKVTKTAIEAILKSREVLFIRSGNKQILYAIVHTDNGKRLLTPQKENMSSSAFEKIVRQMHHQGKVNRKIQLWQGGVNGVMVASKVAIEKTRKFAVSQAKAVLASRKRNPIDVKVSVDQSSERQLMFEMQFFNSMISALENPTVEESFAQELLSQITFLNFSEDEWTAMYGRYRSHFEACMWLIYLGDVRILGYTEPRRHLGENSPMALVDGSGLFGSPTIDYKSIAGIQRPKLVKYLGQSLVCPKSNFGESFQDYFFRIKFNRAIKNRGPYDNRYDRLVPLSRQREFEEIRSRGFNYKEQYGKSQDPDQLFAEMYLQLVAPYLTALSKQLNRLQLIPPSQSRSAADDL